MFNIMIAPNRYVQGPGLLNKIGEHINHLGKRVFFIGGPTAISIVKDCAVENLKENNIEFTDLDVSSDEKARNELIEKSGQMGVPVLDIDGKIIVGFDVDSIKKALNL